MEYVNFGKTGLKVSRLCLGMMTYGSKKWREWVLEEAEARPFIKRALEAGPWKTAGWAKPSNAFFCR
jgi:aryl-alcohol dehydrogenase (NADP+)